MLLHLELLLAELIKSGSSHVTYTLPKKLLCPGMCSVHVGGLSELDLQPMTQLLLVILASVDACHKMAATA
jgi:hypothetical protein